MKLERRKIVAKFASDTRFIVRPAPARGEQEKALERFKERLVQDATAGQEEAATRELLQRAANEAAALAWMTPFPLLFLPGLLDEKVRQAQAQAERQQAVFQRCQSQGTIAA